MKCFSVDSRGRRGRRDDCRWLRKRSDRSTTRAYNDASIHKQVQKTRYARQLEPIAECGTLEAKTLQLQLVLLNNWTISYMATFYARLKKKIRFCIKIILLLLTNAWINVYKTVHFYLLSTCKSRHNRQVTSHKFRQWNFGMCAAVCQCQDRRIHIADVW